MLKPKAVQECIENIAMYKEWVCHIAEELEKLNSLLK